MSFVRLSVEKGGWGGASEFCGSYAIQNLESGYRSPAATSAWISLQEPIFPLAPAAVQFRAAAAQAKSSMRCSGQF